MPLPGIERSGLCRPSPDCRDTNAHDRRGFPREASSVGQCRGVRPSRRVYVRSPLSAAAWCRKTSRSTSPLREPSPDRRPSSARSPRRPDASRPAWRPRMRRWTANLPGHALSPRNCVPEPADSRSSRAVCPRDRRRIRHARLPSGFHRAGSCRKGSPPSSTRRR